MIIKEYCKQSNTVVIRRDDYAHSLKAINELIAIALSDFPTIDIDRDWEEIKIVQYGGKRYKRTFGIEFISPTAIATLEYKRIGVLEYKM